VTLPKNKTLIISGATFMNPNHFGLRRVIHFCALVSFFLSSLLFVQPKTLSAAPATQNAAGAWDDRFGYVGVEGRVTAVAAAPNGDLYVGGDFTKAGGMAANRIARWDGRSWHALGDGLNDLPHSIVVDGTAVYVGGKFTTAPAMLLLAILRGWIRRPIRGRRWATVSNGTTTFIPRSPVSPPLPKAPILVAILTRRAV